MFGAVMLVGNTATNATPSCCFDSEKCLMVAAQRLALQLPPRRTAKTVKMPPISRAGGQTSGRGVADSVDEETLLLD